jgi:SAM-dependent methyltransferase
LGNIDSSTVEGFGDEWQRFTQSEISRSELETIFATYFSIFPWHALSASSEGFDLGCGSGRWARFVAERVGCVHCVDASAAALAVARENLQDLPNCQFHHASVDRIPLADGSMDFGYSLGVLHHVPDTAAGLRACVEKLKPGAPFLVYLYYAFDNRPAWYRWLWLVSEGVRSIVSRLPFPIRYFLSQAIAVALYYPLARSARLLEGLGFGIGAFPLASYRNHSFYTMRTDALDRFGTILEQRFSREQIRHMMEAAGLEQVRFSLGPPYWCAVGTKSR